MSKFLKTLSILGILTAICAIVFGVYHMIELNYLNHNFFSGIFIVLIAAAAIYGCVKGIRYVRFLSIIAIVSVTLASCNYAKSNQQVLVSKDCGSTWEQVPAGDAVPKGGVNPCYMKVVIPNHPMQGQTGFVCNLKDRVRAEVRIEYDYSINQPLPFIKQAKYLGNANADADSEAALNTSAFESAENSVIDTRLRDVAKGLLLSEDIVEMDQAEAEALIQSKTNQVLSDFGVELNFITLTFDLDEQTRQAIDVSTALKIYQSKGIEDLGRAVIVQRSGAAKINVSQPQPQVVQPAEESK